ncbi:hypothetical protein HDF24_22870 [Mucilaginibacter sp. X4EP1]|uniref:hypothetical protein n=1 Tax=Mucilaginibacter sp. X4EP1 TaxID=2723092 RepID=UPI002168E161|nr:hypothetical protein [Mucilaginibacter sp. X4EP1]MCS3815977.1 hypothetical protein [Mucilaginibacter sp. X4EP1]
MNSINVRRVTGISGIAIFLLSMVVLPLYFVYSGPPPVSNILTRVLINMFVCTALIIFLVGFRYLIREARPDFEFIATLSFTFGLVFAIITFVSDAIQVGSVLGKSGGIDPTTVGSGAESAILLFGPIGRLLTSMFLFTAASAILGTHLLPKWTARMAQIIAVFHFALIPSIFSGTNPAYFYSINGLGIPISGTFLLIWILAVGIILFRKKS